jgi:hypothetical protein
MACHPPGVVADDSDATQKQNSQSYQTSCGMLTTSDKGNPLLNMQTLRSISDIEYRSEFQVLAGQAALTVRPEPGA